MPVLPSLNAIKKEPTKAEEIANTTNQELASNNTTKSISKTEISAAIQAYALDMKVKDRMFEYVLFNEREVQYESGKLVFTLENELQKTQLNEYKAPFIDHMRQLFGINFTIEIEIATTAAETKKLLYTPTDKYKFMAEKYPVLEELKKRLGLELEF